MRTETRDDQDEPEIVHVRVNPDLSRKLRVLLEEPTFGFQNLEHLVNVGLYSFYSYKMSQLRRLRGDAEGLQ